VLVMDRGLESAAENPCAMQVTNLYEEKRVRAFFISAERYIRGTPHVLLPTLHLGRQHSEAQAFTAVGLP
jgi:hypothetical protein